MQSDLYDFCRLFHQDFEIYGTTGDEIIARILGIIGVEKSERLGLALTQILASGMTDPQLSDLWEQSPADIRLKEEGDYRPFLVYVRDMAARYAQRHNR